MFLLGNCESNNISVQSIGIELGLIGTSLGKRKTVVEDKVCERISHHGAVLDQTALGDCVSDKFNVNDVSDLQLRSR